MKLISTNSGVQAGAVYHYYIDGTVYYRLAVYYYPTYMCDAPDGCRHGFEIHAVDAAAAHRIAPMLDQQDADDAIAHGECELVDYGDFRSANYMTREIRRAFSRHTGRPVTRLPRRVTA